MLTVAERLMTTSAAFRYDLVLDVTQLPCLCFSLLSSSSVHSGHLNTYDGFLFCFVFVFVCVCCAPVLWMWTVLLKYEKRRFCPNEHQYLETLDLQQLPAICHVFPDPKNSSKSCDWGLTTWSGVPEGPGTLRVNGGSLIEFSFCVSSSRP